MYETMNEMGKFGIKIQFPTESRQKSLQIFFNWLYFGNIFNTIYINSSSYSSMFSSYSGLLTKIKLEIIIF